MAFDPNFPVDIYVCFGQERGTLFPHWMIMLRTRDAGHGTWYHTSGGPSQNRPYEVLIQSHKRVDSHGIKAIEYLGTISPKDVGKVTAAAKAIQPQQCQTYCVAVIARLENRGLLEPGKAIELHGRVQMSERALRYAQDHPVDRPTFHPASHGRATSFQAPKGIQGSSGVQGRSCTPPAARQASPVKKDKEGCCLVM